MLFNESSKVAIFIDGANLHASTKALQIDIDYKKLLEFFGSRSNLIRAYYYTALLEDGEYSSLRPLVDWLDYNGYTTVTKPAKRFTDNGVTRIKGNMDIDLAVDVIEICPFVDHIVLFSGDGDFCRLLDFVQRKAKRVTVVSTIRTNPPIAADELRRQADCFIELNDLAPFIRRNGNNGVTHDSDKVEERHAEI